MDAVALLASYPDAAAQVQGPADLRLRGNLGRKWHGSGGVDLMCGRVFGAVVDELHLPVTFEFSPTLARSGRVTIRDANAQLAGGRATGQAEFDWSRGEAPRLDGEARFNNAEVRLDLDVTGGTGTLGVNPTFLQAIGLRIPAVGPIPVSLILEATALLSNRVVHLRITGTVRNPNVQVETAQLLAEEAVRFFVLQSGAPVP